MSERVPEGWATKRLSDVTTQTKGLTYKSEDYGDENNGLPFLTLKSISKSGGYSPLGLKFYKGDFKPHHLIESGDILFANTDLTRDGDVVGSPLYFDSFEFQTKPLYSMDLSKLVVDPSESVGKFLYYLLMTHRVKRFMINASAGSTVLHLDTKSVKSLPIILPPLPEQKKIASILTSVDEVIEATQKQIDKLQDLKKATMNELLTKGIGHTEFKNSELGRIPKSWEVNRLDQISIISRGKFSHRPRNDPNFYDGKYPYLQTGDIPTDDTDITSFNQTLNDRGLTVSKLFPKGTLVLTIAATIGEVGMLTFESCFPDSLVGIGCKKNKTSTYFLLYALRSAKQKLIAEAPESAQKNLNLDILNPFPIAVPSLTEQKEIENILLSIDDNLKEKSHKLNQTQSLKKSLMQDLLTGKVRVQVN